LVKYSLEISIIGDLQKQRTHHWPQAGLTGTQPVAEPLDSIESDALHQQPAGIAIFGECLMEEFPYRAKVTQHTFAR
jgi:hypothetical protein